MPRANPTTPRPVVAAPRARRALARLLAMTLIAVVALFFPNVELAEAFESSFEHRTPPTVAAAPRTLPATAGLDDHALAAAAAGGRRQATENQAEHFEAIGVSFPALPSEPVLLRVRDAEGWGPWMEVGFEPDEAPDDDPAGGRPGVHSAPIWVGDADAYQLNLAGDAGGPEVHLGRERRTRSFVRVAPEPAGAVMSINPRSAWGARQPSRAPEYATDFRLGVVHHSVNANDYAAAAVPAMLRSIQSFHMDVNGWSDIGYNFAVDRFGRIWEAHSGGTDRMVIGGHARGFNTGSTGVVVLGEYGAVAPSTASVQAVASVLAWKFAIHGVDPAGTVPYTTTGSTRYAEGQTVVLNRIVGHRDVGQTGCPGSNLYDRLGQIRALTAQWFALEIPYLPTRLFTGNFDGNWGDDVILERQAPVYDPVWFSQGAAAMYKALSWAPGIYRPAVGDFDGDGRSDILWHGPGTTGDHLWFGNPAGFQGLSFDIPGSHQPFVGDFDGDGRDDVYLYGEGMSPDRLAYGTADRRWQWTEHPMTGTYEPFIGDFDGDGRDDVLLHDFGRGTHYILYGTASGAFAQVEFTAFGEYEPFVGDFDGDDRTDIFWHNPGPGGDHIWFMGQRGAIDHSIQTQVIGRYTHLVGDYDGNGEDDILWYAPGFATHTMWMNVGGSFSGRVVGVGAVYQPVVVDIDDLDAYADILWYSPAGSTIWRGGPTGFTGINT